MGGVQVILWHFLLNATYNTGHYNAEMIMRALHPNLSGQAFQFTGLTLKK